KPKEIPIGKLIYELFREHRRKKTVARFLNDKVYRTRNGSPFTDTTVDRQKDVKWRLDRFAIWRTASVVSGVLTVTSTTSTSRAASASVAARTGTRFQRIHARLLREAARPSAVGRSKSAFHSIPCCRPKTGKQASNEL